MAVKTRGLVPRLWRKLRRILLILFLLHLAYILLLRWVDPPFTLTQLSSLMSGNGLQRDYVDWTDISPHLKLAFIAAEDQKFPDHYGFDWHSISKAIDHNKRKPEKIRGASTISQQVAKNVFLWQGRSWVRKGLEGYFTLMIELVWGKKRILEMYLNVAETGKGIFGVEAAAQQYFRKPAKLLTKKESAMIAAALPSPVRYTIVPVSGYISKHYPRILKQMSNLETDPDIVELLQ